MQQENDRYFGHLNGLSKSTCYDKQLSYLTLLDIASRGILDVVGDDVGGRKIILISACRFPTDRVSYIAKLESYHVKS